jgi:hypothetical protein
MSEKDSEKSGSQPEDKKEVKDAKVDSSTTTDAKKEESSDSVPWHNDPRFKQDLKLLKAVKSLVEANGLEDVSELTDLVESGKKVHGKQIDLDKLDEILAKASKLDQYQKHWETQEELRKRGMETPEQTIARLQAEREAERSERSRREQIETEAANAKKAVMFYESEIKNQLDDLEGLSADEKGFLAYTLGVGNECNDINITDKRAIKRILNDSVKKYNNLVKSIKEQAIKEYREGKASIPSVPSTDGSAAATKTEPPKGLKGMRNAFAEMMRKGSGQ